MGDNYVPVMECTVLSVAEDVFRAKKPGETDRTMYRLYMADAHGRVGYLYSSKAHAAGDVVRLALPSGTANCGWPLWADSPYI